MPLPAKEGELVKKALASHEEAWRSNMGDLIMNEPLWQRSTGQRLSGWTEDNAPAVGSEGVTTDQRKLSYSFDFGIVHLAVVNTDPVGLDDSVVSGWLKRDFEAARARGIRTFLVFGHKPAFTYRPAPPVDLGGTSAAKTAERPDGLDFHTEMRDAFWDVIEAFGATYFCGHQHVYHASQPRVTEGGKAWQVIVGSGGSPLSIKPGRSSNPFDSQYAWAEVEVHANGAVEMLVRGFRDPESATGILERVELQSAR
jgi:hypothetical protein